MGIMHMSNQDDDDELEAMDELQAHAFSLTEQLATATMQIGLYQTALTALVIKYGGDMIVLLPHEVEKALGRVFRMQYERPDGVVLLEVLHDENEGLPAPTHSAPETRQ